MMVLEIVKVSPRTQAYIEAICRLEKKTGLARTSDLAKDLNVALGTITNTVESLEKKGFATSSFA